MTKVKSGITPKLPPDSTEQSDTPTGHSAAPAQSKLPAPNLKPKTAPATVSKALALYQAGHLTSVIASEYKVAWSTLTFWVKRAGMPLRKQGRKKDTTPPERAAMILGMARTMPQAKVARLLGISKQEVYRTLERWENWVPVRVLGADTRVASQDSNNGPLQLWTPSP